MRALLDRRFGFVKTAYSYRRDENTVRDHKRKGFSGGPGLIPADGKVLMWLTILAVESAYRVHPRRRQSTCLLDISLAHSGLVFCPARQSTREVFHRRKNSYRKTIGINYRLERQSPRENTAKGRDKVPVKGATKYPWKSAVFHSLWKNLLQPSGDGRRRMVQREPAIVDVDLGGRILQ